MAITSTSLSVVAALAVVGVASAAHATFVVYDNIQMKDEIKIFLDNQMDVTSDTAETMKNLANVNVTTNTGANFANGFATIKPAGNELLTTLTFTPTDQTAFSDFTFRGQDLVSDQDFTVTVTDNSGGTTSFTFNGGNSNADFSRLGVISLDGETIRSVTVSNPGGFKEFKQAAFSTGSAVPEPASWAMMMVGVGLAGAQLRRSRARPAKALI